MTQDRKRPSNKNTADPASKQKSALTLAKRELQEALDRQAATNEILHIISSSPSDTQPVFEAIVRSGSKLFPGSAISVALPKGDRVDAVAVADEDPDRAEAWRRRFPFPLSRDYMHGVVILEGRELDIPDVAKAPNRDTTGAKNFLASGYRAVTLMPMLRDGKAIGVLGIVRLAPGPLSDAQLAVLRAFAAQAVIAIENTRLMNEFRQTNSVLENVSHQLAKYISPQLYQSILSGERDVTIESKRKKLTIFFSDIVSFTEITDQMESEELTALLNEYLTEMSHIAEEHGANFDKFIGDAIMCYFGDPESKGVKEDAEACVRMALAMQNRLRELQSGWRDRGVIDRPFEARMGINTGYCTVGNFGSLDRMDYTIIGHEVNLAARLESHADAGGILMAAETHSLVKDWLLAEEQDAIMMKGFSQPVRTYRVRGTHEELAKDENFFHHEDEGVVISIEGGRADRQKTKEALERALAQLNR
ncbi:adenylate/guanylate cyclase domain-containing protein [Pelagibius marinus]|uniref:adenylate/guanylate cyclase domain-containing protein n=1 Tax=Pelagibius marinus TaxID=2762760 RepID=UPI001872B81C|nr:adenylate/guanylate cyclase domain-containing protein [Pelagibius marinus]